MVDTNKLIHCDVDSILRVQQGDDNETNFLIGLTERESKFHGEIVKRTIIRDGKVSEVKIGFEKSIK